MNLKGGEHGLEKSMDCYKCKHRRMIPGDAHSRCDHPEVRKTGIDDDPIGALAQAWLGTADGAAKKLGIRGGGSTWPTNFDPVFLKACSGFTAKALAPHHADTPYYEKS